MIFRLADLRPITALCFPEDKKPPVFRKEKECLYITFCYFLAKRLVSPVDPISGKRWSNWMISRVKAGLLPLFSAGNFIRLGPSAKFLSLMVAEVFCRAERSQILQEPMLYQDEHQHAEILYYRDQAIKRKVLEIASGYLRPFLSGETRMSLPVFKALQSLVLFCWRTFEKYLEQDIIFFECGNALDHESSDVTMHLGLDEYYKTRQLLQTIKEVIQRLSQSIE